VVRDCANLGERAGENRAGGRPRRELTMTAPKLPNVLRLPSELNDKILFTLLCLVVYRIGAHIATPGVNIQVLSELCP